MLTKQLETANDVIYREAVQQVYLSIRVKYGYPRYGKPFRSYSTSSFCYRQINTNAYYAVGHKRYCIQPTNETDRSTCTLQIQHSINSSVREDDTLWLMSSFSTQAHLEKTDTRKKLLFNAVVQQCIAGSNDQRKDKEKIRHGFVCRASTIRVWDRTHWNRFLCTDWPDWEDFVSWSLLVMTRVHKECISWGRFLLEDVAQDRCRQHLREDEELPSIGRDTVNRRPCCW